MIGVCLCINLGVFLGASEAFHDNSSMVVRDITAALNARAFAGALSTGRYHVQDQKCPKSCSAKHRPAKSSTTDVSRNKDSSTFMHAVISTAVRAK
jgi:hypothetical protein